MPIANRRDRDEATQLVRALADAPRQGIPMVRLSAKLNLSSDRIESLVRRNPKYFLRVGDRPSYRINPFSEFNGSVNDVLVDIEHSFKKNSNAQMIGAIGVLVCALVTFITAIS